MIGYLCSFYFFAKADMRALAESSGRPGLKFFADCGAYSAHEAGEPVSLADYANWLRTWDEVLDPYVNLDVKYDWEAGEANQRELEGLGLRPTPVYHLGEPISLLREMCQRHDFVAIGNLTTGNKRDPKLWGAIDLVHGVAAEHGAGLHGFGLSSWPMVRRWPWRSVDSSSMGASFRYGRLSVYDPFAKRWKAWNTNDAAAWYRHGWLLREYGFEPAEFAGQSRRDQLVPLMRLAGATWARAAHDLDGTDVYLVDLGFPQVIEDKTRLAWYEQGVRMAEGVYAS